MNLVDKIIRIRKKYTIAEIFVIIFKRYIFDIIRMEKYSMYFHQMALISTKTPYTLAICKEDEYEDVVQTNPYLTEDDVSAFSKCNAICTVVKDKGKIIGSKWYVSDTDYYLEEAKQLIHIKENEYYALRAFTHEDYRGEKLQNHLSVKFMEYIDSPNSTVWGLIYSWNINSKKSMVRNGFHHIGQMVFIKLFGFKFNYLSSNHVNKAISK